MISRHRDEFFLPLGQAPVSCQTLKMNDAEKQRWSRYPCCPQAPVFRCNPQRTILPGNDTSEESARDESQRIARPGIDDAGAQPAGAGCHSTLHTNRLGAGFDLGTALTMSLEGVHHRPVTGEASHSLMLQGTLNWEATREPSFLLCCGKGHSPLPW